MFGFSKNNSSNAEVVKVLQYCMAGNSCGLEKSNAKCKLQSGGLRQRIDHQRIQSEQHK